MPWWPVCKAAVNNPRPVTASLSTPHLAVSTASRAAPRPPSATASNNRTPRSGQIAGPELQAALRQGGLEFNIDTAHRMVNMFNTTGNGVLQLQEFQTCHAWTMQMASAFQAVRPFPQRAP